MINSVKARTPILALILFVFGVGYTFAANRVVIIPMAADDVPKEALPLAYGFIAGTNALTGYNVASVTNSETGLYVITLDNGYSGQPVVTALSYNNDFGTEVVTYNALSPNKIRIRIVDEEDNPKESNFSFVVYGSRL